MGKRKDGREAISPGLLPTLYSEEARDLYPAITHTWPKRHSTVILGHNVNVVFYRAHLLFVELKNVLFGLIDSFLLASHNDLVLMHGRGRDADARSSLL